MICFKTWSQTNFELYTKQIGIGLPITEEPSQVSSPKELPLQALSEPDVNLSTHPAPIVQPFFFQDTPMYKKVRLSFSNLCQPSCGLLLTSPEFLIFTGCPTY